MLSHSIKNYLWTVILLIITFFTTSSRAVPMSASIEFSGQIVADLLSLPLEGIRSLILKLPNVPDGTGGCHTGLNSGPSVSSFTWGSSPQVTFGPNGAVSASATMFSLGGSVSVLVQDCSTLCASCIFTEDEALMSIGNVTETPFLGCGWLQCCCHRCRATASWSLGNVGYNVQLTVTKNILGMVMPTVTTADLTTDWESINVESVTCYALWGLVKITLSNIWGQTYPGVKANMQPLVQVGMIAVFSLIDTVVCDAQTVPDSNHFYVTTYINATTGQCMALPPITTFPLDPRSFSIVVLLSLPIPFFSGTLCSQPATCLEPKTLPNFPTVTVSMQNCQICLGVQPNGIYLGISADAVVTGLPPEQGPRPLPRSMNPTPRRRRGKTNPKSKSKRPLRKAVIGSEASPVQVNGTITISAQALTYTVADTASATSHLIAAFQHEASNCEPFEQLGMCCITYPGFTFQQFSPTVDTTATVSVTSQSNASATLRVTLPRVPTTLTVTVPVSEILCIVPTPAFTQLTDSTSATLYLNATMNEPMAIDLTRHRKFLRLCARKQQESRLIVYFHFLSHILYFFICMQ